MKKDKYNRMRKTILASAGTSIVAGMLLIGGANTALAEGAEVIIPAYTQNSIATGMHMMHRWNSPRKINSLAVHLGLDPAKVREELKSGKTLKQILQENGIVLGQIQKAFENNHKMMRGWKKN